MADEAFTPMVCCGTTMRTYWRQRNDLVRAAGRHIQRMQKALTQMNIQLANALSDASWEGDH
jgi:transposase